MIHDGDRDVTVGKIAFCKLVRMRILCIRDDIDMVDERCESQNGGDAEIDFPHRTETGRCGHLFKILCVCVAEKFSPLGLVDGIFPVNPCNHNINRFHAIIFA